MIARSKKKRKVNQSTVIFSATGDILPEYIEQIQNNWDSMCQGSVDKAYSVNALSSAVYMIVNVDNNDQVVSFLLVLDHTFNSPLTDEPVCKENEWYLDVVCAMPKKGYGRRVIRELYDKAKEYGKDTIRLYAVKEAENYWKKVGFVECDQPCDFFQQECYTKVYKEDPEQGKRMTKCLRRIQILHNPSKEQKITFLCKLVSQETKTCSYKGEMFSPIYLNQSILNAHYIVFATHGTEITGFLLAENKEDHVYISLICSSESGLGKKIHVVFENFLTEHFEDGHSIRLTTIHHDLVKLYESWGYTNIFSGCSSKCLMEKNI